MNLSPEPSSRSSSLLFVQQEQKFYSLNATQPTPNGQAVEAFKPSLSNVNVESSAVPHGPYSERLQDRTG
jgi:hypothetical protein